MGTGGPLLGWGEGGRMGGGDDAAASKQAEVSLLSLSIGLQCIHHCGAQRLGGLILCCHCQRRGRAAMRCQVITLREARIDALDGCGNAVQRGAGGSRRKMQLAAVQEFTTMRSTGRIGQAQQHSRHSHHSSHHSPHLSTCSEHTAAITSDGVPHKCLGRST